MPDAGVPLNTPAEESVTPLGSTPDSEKVGAGKPVAATVNEPAVPTVNEVLFALVKDGAWPTVSVKLWVAFGLTPLLAEMVKLKIPVWVGVPLRTPVLVKVTPFGKVPVSLSVGDGKPVAVTVNEPAWLITKPALLPLVIAGA